MIFSLRTIACKAIQGTAVCRRTVVAAAVTGNTTIVPQQQRSYFVCGGYTGLPAFTTNTTTIAIPQKLQFGTTSCFNIRRPLPLSFSYSPFVIVSCSPPADVSFTATVQFICTALYNFAVAAAAASTPKTLQLTNFSSSSSNQQVIPYQYCSDASPSFLLGLLVQCIANLLTRVKLLSEVRKYAQEKETLIARHKKLRSRLMKELKKFFKERLRVLVFKKAKKAIRCYTGNGYKAINSALRKGVGSKELDEEQGHIDALVLAWSKLSSIKKFEGTVYRSVQYLPSIIDDLVVGAIFTDPAFLSTSRCKEFGYNFSGNFGRKICFEIHSKTGIDITKFSKYGNREEEVLFRPATKFRIISVEKTFWGSRNVVMKEI